MTGEKKTVQKFTFEICGNTGTLAGWGPNGDVSLILGCLWHGERFAAAADGRRRYGQFEQQVVDRLQLMDVLLALVLLQVLHPTVVVVVAFRHCVQDVEAALPAPPGGMWRQISRVALCCVQR